MRCILHLLRSLSHIHYPRPRPHLLVFKRAILPFILGAITSASVSQSACDHVVRGAVIDDHDGEGLGLAEIRVVELARTVHADEEGAFILDALCAGRYTLRAVHVGCEPVELVLEVPRSRPLRIRLEHHVAELKEVEVARERPDENVGHAQQHVDAGAMSREAGKGIAEMLALVPGVSTLRSGPTIGKPVLHGLSGNRVLTLNQGVRQEDQQWGTEHAPDLDPFSSDQLTVVKGAAAVQYGSDAIGGVVIAEPVELPRGSGTSGELRTLGILNGRGGGANARLQGGIKGMRGIGWRVQGGGKYLGDSEAPDYVLSNTGVREAGLSATLGYRDYRWNASIYNSWFSRELGIMRAAHIGNLTDLRNAIESGTPWYVGERTYAIEAPRQQAAHQLLKTEAGYAIGPRTHIGLTYARQSNDRQEYDVRRAGRSAIPALDLSLITHTGDAVLKHWLGPHIHGKMGLSGTSQVNRNIPGTGVRPLVPNYRRRSAGVFVLEHFPVHERLELEAGARVEAADLAVAYYDIDDVLRTPDHRFTNQAWSVGANYRTRDSSEVRFNISTAYRPPHVSELYSEGLHHGAAAIELGDPDLASERAHKAVLDLRAHGCGGRLQADVTLHASSIDGFIYLRPDGVSLTIRGAFPVFRYVATDAFLTGLDATIGYRFDTHWKWRARGSTVRARDRGAGQWLFQMPADRIENSILYTPAEKGTWNALEFEATVLSVFRQQRVPAGLDFTAAPDAYHLIGISAGATKAIGKQRIRFALRAENLLDTAYRDLLDRFRYYADARGLDVVLSITWSFGKHTN